MSYTPLNNIVLTGEPETTGDLRVGDDLQVVDQLRLGEDDGIGWVTLARDDDGVSGWIEANDPIRYGGTPVHGDELVNRDYVDSVATGLDLKESVRVASQADVTIAAPGAAIDGVTLATGDRVLLKAQAAGEENGIYVFDTDVTPMVRAADADSNDEVNAGMFVFVEEGTNADQGWVLTTNNPIDLDVDALAFSQFSNAVIVSTLDSLTDVDVTGAVANAALVFDGSDWYDSVNILLDDANSTISLGAASLADDGSELTITASDGLNLNGGTGDINLESTDDIWMSAADNIEMQVDNGVDPSKSIQLDAVSGIEVTGLATFNDGIVQNNAAGIEMQLGALEFKAYAAAADLVVTSDVTGDVEDRFQMSADGKMLWGDGALAADVNLYRAAADSLQTDDDFTAANLLSGGDLDVQGAVKLGASDAIELIENGDNELEIVGADLRTDNNIAIDDNSTLTVYVEEGVSDSYGTYGSSSIDFGGENSYALINYSDANERLDIEAPLIRLRDTLEVQEGLRFTGKFTISANTTLDAENDHVVLVDVSAAAVTVTLPAAPADGTIFQIKDMMGNAEAENITVAGNGKNIDGAADFVMGVDYQSSTVIYDAAADAWFLI